MGCVDVASMHICTLCLPVMCGRCGWYQHQPLSIALALDSYGIAPRLPAPSALPARTHHVLVSFLWYRYVMEVEGFQLLVYVQGLVNGTSGILGVSSAAAANEMQAQVWPGRQDGFGIACLLDLIQAPHGKAGLMQPEDTTCFDLACSGVVRRAPTNCDAFALYSPCFRHAGARCAVVGARAWKTLKDVSVPFCNPQTQVFHCLQWII